MNAAQQLTDRTGRFGDRARRLAAISVTYNLVDAVIALIALIAGARAGSVSAGSSRPCA